jgi:hypothetical protein
MAGHNPYSAPTATVRDAVDADWSWKPVILGVLVCLGTFYSLSILSNPILKYWYLAQGVPHDGLYRTVTTAVEAVVLLHLLAITAYITGGYVSAANSHRRPLLTACLAAVLTKTVLLVQYLGIYSYPYPWWSQVLGLITPVPAALIGGWLQMRRA